MRKIETTLLTMTILHNRDTNKILLIDRPKELGFPGFLGPGGKIELTESFSEGAAREVREETGLIVEPEDLNYKGVDEFVIPNDNYRYIVFNYVTSKFKGELLGNSPEGTPKWVSLDELDTIAMQDWFKRRLPMFFEKGTFEISAILEDLKSAPIKEKIKKFV